MDIKAIIRRYTPKIILDARRRKYAHEWVTSFEFDPTQDVRAAIQESYGHDGDLLDMFTRKEGAVVHKWHHYIPIYERYFSSFRGKKVRMLEIGVSEGGSLDLWRQYFGEDAVIFGIDIDDACARLNGVSAQVRVGSQIDLDFLESVVEEMGGVDIVLDDGSHHMAHVPKTLNHLFPHLSEGGIYMIEDLHTAYWRSYGGGYRARRNFFSSVLGIIDNMHHWYHLKGIDSSLIGKDCAGIHIHDSVAVFEKKSSIRPAHSRIGSRISRSRELPERVND